MAEKKTRKPPVRTPASDLMRTLAAMERLMTKLPPEQRSKAVKMFNSLMEPPLFSAASTKAEGTDQKGTA